MAKAGGAAGGRRAGGQFTALSGRLVTAKGLVGYAPPDEAATAARQAQQAVERVEKATKQLAESERRTGQVGAQAMADYAKAVQVAERALEALRKKEEQVEQARLRAVRLARDTARGLVSSVDAETGQRTYRYGGPRTAGQAVRNFLLGTPTVDKEKGTFGERSGGLLSKFGLDVKTLGPALAVTAALQAARTAKAAGDAYQDEQLTANQRDRAILSSLPFGETALSYADTVTGRGRAMARVAERGQVLDAREAGRAQTAAQRQELAAGTAAARARANAFAGASAGQLPYVDRTGGTSERQYRLEQQRLQVQERLAAAARAEAAAHEQIRQSEQSLAGFGRSADRADRDAAAARQRADEAGERGRAATPFSGIKFGIAGLVIGGLGLGDADRQEALGDAARADQRANSFDQQRMAEQRRIAELERQRTAARVEQAGARAEGLRAEAGGLEERAAGLSSLAQRVATSPVARLMDARYAARRFERLGVRGLSPAEQALVQEFLPEDFRAAAEREGQQGPRGQYFAEFTRIGRRTYDGRVDDPEELRRRANENRNQAATLQFDAERAAATALAKFEETLETRMTGALNRVFDRIDKQIETGQFLNKGNR